MKMTSKDHYRDAIAIVGIGAVMPDAGDAPTFWRNIKDGRCSIGEVPPDRWDASLYYDPDHAAPDRTYSKIGGFVRSFDWKPFDWKLPIPPTVGEAMDRAQKWGIIASRQALLDFGYPERGLDRSRTAVILGNAMAGDMHYLTAARILSPEIVEELRRTPSFAALPEQTRQALTDELGQGVDSRFPPITEDTMPGELSNIIAGRVAALFDLHGPNFVTDAACASSMASLTAAVDGLREGSFDAVLTGGIDANMGPTPFIKFSKIGALSATGSRPYDQGADGFIMGEGAAVFLLRRLEDAERDGDQIYAVIRGFGGSSDGKGKGIVAPNPAGQVRAMTRAWEAAGCDPRSATLIEGHGTSTAVGDAVELQCLEEVFGGEGRAPGSLALGSVKSNIGHLKGAAGAAGLLKATLALHEKVLPPSLGWVRPGSDAPLSGAVKVNVELRPWPTPECGVRWAGVSSFGFGGTNFHAVLEEYVPGRLEAEYSGGGGGGGISAGKASAVARSGIAPAAQAALKSPLRGALLLGGADEQELGRRLGEVLERADRGEAPEVAPPARQDLDAPERLALDYGDAQELAQKAQKALRALQSGDPAMWRVLRAQGIFRGSGRAPRVAFLFTGQGSQYVNMMAGLWRAEPLMAAAMEEADRVMAPLLDRPLSSYIFVDAADPERVAQAEQALRQTAVTQPALLAVEAGLLRLLDAYGVRPDLVMGHSLGEYGALQAAGALSFAAGMEAVSARGREMSSISTPDNGAMVAVMGSLEQIQRMVDQEPGYAVIANINSNDQAVVGGATEAVRHLAGAMEAAGMRVTPLSVSHAFHTEIVAPASAPLRRTLDRLNLQPPNIPVVANVTGELYPAEVDRAEILDILARQVASPVQFVKGLNTLYDQGARVFVEVGPKKALYGMVENVLGHHGDLVALFTNHPKAGDLNSFNQCLCGLYAAGLGDGQQAQEQEPVELSVKPRPLVAVAPPTPAPAPAPAVTGGSNKYEQLGHLLEQFMGQAASIYGGGGGDAPVEQPVIITGAGLGLPGGERVFDDENLSRMLRGEQLIGQVPLEQRQAMAGKAITRLRKSADGVPRFETIDHPADVIKLAGRAGALDLVQEFGVPEERMAALDATTRLAMGAGLEALRDAGIPMSMRYRTTSTGRRLPDRWGLPDALRDDTGVIFASAFPGLTSLVDELNRYHRAHGLAARMADLEALKDLAAGAQTPDPALAQELSRRIEQLGQEAAEATYSFDRRFLFKILAMGHSQFAELIGARGPNTHINSACASGTQALSLAQDWIRAGRCRRVICVTADDVTNDTLMEWMGAGFLASGAAATDERVEDAALPFDRRRHGLVLGMGASGLVIESQESASERGLAPICELLGTITANSAFHGSRLDPAHIAELAEELLSSAEARHGLRREEMAPRTVFVSHETFTPRRGGSAQAEVQTLRSLFGHGASQVVVANTKGLTGHAMGAGIEDALAVRVLETGLVPPVVNFKEPDPELGDLNLSRGGDYQPSYALRLAAGFGSQLSMALLRHTPLADGRRPGPENLGHEYRITDPARWGAWTRDISGEATPELEVVNRTLLFKDLSSSIPAPAPAPAPSVPTPEPETNPRQQVVDRVLSLVAEQTGYPLEMLELDLDMEADLGVDTVKQAETFSAVREAYDIPMKGELKLRDMPTLDHVVQWVMDNQESSASASASASASDSASVSDSASASAEAEPLIDLTLRAPWPVLRPPLALCKPSGVTLDPGTRTLLMPDRFGVGRSLSKRLIDRGVEVLELSASATADELADTISAYLEQGPVHGVFWLPALDTEGAAATNLEAWRQALEPRLRHLFVTMKALASHGSENEAPFLVAGTRLGGTHGYGDISAPGDPMGGAVTGFVKSYKREQPGALVKAVDLSPSRKKAALADLLIQEALTDPGVVEVGYRDGHRWTVGLIPLDELPASARPSPDGGVSLDGDTVYLVTGAAGSIVSAIITDLARNGGGTFHLLDLAPCPDEDDPDIARFTSDRDGLAREIFQRLKASGERATPAMVERQLAALERGQAALAAQRAIREAGGRAVYHQLDLRDPEAVAAALDQVRQEHGRVDVLLHAAGLEISHPLPDKEVQEFDLVFGVKSDGWANLMAATENMPLGATVSFSSIAGRFGNAGQTDYAAANDLLCKAATAMSQRRPDTLALSLDWTAWAGIGMATRGSIPKVMERAGIEMLDPTQGVPLIRRLLLSGARGELVVAGELGLLLEEFDGSGGLDPSAVGEEAGGIMASQAVAMGLYDGLTVETTLDPSEQPFLRDHQIDGTPVLPGVMGIEGFAEAARLLLPGWEITSLEDVNFLAPFKFYRGEPRALRLQAHLMRDGEQVLARCRLVGERYLPGSAEPRVTVHFSARVGIAPGPVAEEAASASVPAPEGGVERQDIYRLYFHGPAYQVLEQAWRNEQGSVAGMLPRDLPRDLGPKAARTITDPRLIELCFQTAGVWEAGKTGRMGLPRHIDQVNLVRRQDDPGLVGRLTAVVTPETSPSGEPSSFDAYVADEQGRVCLTLRGYSTVQHPDPLAEEVRRPLQEAMD